MVSWTRKKEKWSCIKFFIESVFVVILHFAYSAGAHTSLMNPSSVSSAFILLCVISLHGGHRHLFPPRLRQDKAFFSLHWWNGCSSALYSKKRKKKTEFIFSVHPYSNLLAKMFFYWFGRPGVFSLRVNVYIYIDVHVWQNKIGSLFLCVCWCFFSAGRFTVCVNGSLRSRAALLPKRSYLFYTVFCHIILQ